MTNRDYQAPMVNGEPHPLRDVPQQVLDVARDALQSAHDVIVNDDVAPVADMIVLRLYEAGFLTGRPDD